ncbi:MAG: cyclic nucleotide-binding protein [Micavibrio sp.]|nr:cyclic nucleotide-binding protein [Micavibrio sp.]|tara:strand:- start:7881 stop:8414 length:534 start_codon:yes stop_codon:yes gene_type:complete
MKKSDSIILERRFVPKGTLIIKQGEAGNCAYLIQSGVVRVYTQHEEKKIDLAKLGSGQIFGEMALIFDENRSASVVAVEDCNLIILTRQTLKQKLDRSDPTVRAIVTMLTQRVVTANNEVINKKSDIQDLLDTTRIIYQNTLSALPRTQQRTFQNAVLPKLDDFFNAVKSFQERFSK